MRYKLIGENDVFNVRELIFKNRGINDIDRFLNPTEEEVHSYKLLNNIDTGVKMLSKHLAEDNKIHVVVDSDCDGYTSSAVLINYIKSIYPKAQISHHVHEKKVHGIILEEFETIGMNFDLLIVPDAGSNNHAEIKHMIDHGKDVLVLDHHPADISPYGCTINPQLDDYPNKQLSGSMVVYKFCKAMDEYLSINHADDFLDLAVVGLIGDMMDTTVLENRYYINKFLSQSIQNHFLQAIVDKQAYSINGNFNIKAVSFYIVPLLNGCIRVGSMEDKYDLMRSFIDKDAITVYSKKNQKESIMPLYKDMPRRMANLKAKQDRAKSKTVAFALGSEESILYNGIIAIVQVEDSETKGVICAQLASTLKKPVIVLSVDEDKTFSGSARGYEKHYISKLKPLLEEIGSFELIEGHDNAFGVEITEKNLFKLTTALSRRFKDIDTSSQHNVDLVVNAKGMSRDVVETMASFKNLWGKGFTLPKIAVVGVKHRFDESFFNEKVFKFVNGTGVEFVKFKPDVEELEKLKGKNVLFEIVGECDLNSYGGSLTPQIIIQDWSYKAIEDEFVF